MAVVFAPDTDGVFSSELLVASDDPDTPTLIVSLTGEGVPIPGELTVEVAANSDAFVFGDTLQVNLIIENTGEPVTVDLFVALTFDLGGPEERHWSALVGRDWAEGLLHYDTHVEIETGHDETAQVLSTTLPSDVPMVVKTGDYTLRTVAVEAGTLDFLTDIATAQFTLDGEPFVGVSTDKATYTLDGDTVVISLVVDVPYDLTADVYVLMLAPDGQFWSPTGFGEASWVSDIVPIIPSIALDGGFTFSGPAFAAGLPVHAPFNTAGEFTLFTALVEPGTLTPFSDIGTATFALQ